MSTPMDVIVSLSKRRASSSSPARSTAGPGSCWDYGPLGVELKNNIKRVWWRDFVQQRADMVGLDASILMHPTVWKASGHVDNFTDPMVDCRECKRRFRADHVDELPWTHFCEATKGNKFTIPAGEAVPPLRPAPHAVPGVRQGRADGAAAVQPDVQDVHGAGGGGRVGHLPASGDRPGRSSSTSTTCCSRCGASCPSASPRSASAFRNEITPGNFIFRTREFEQMEIEFFVNPHERRRSPRRRVLARPLDRGLHGVVPALRPRRRAICACASTKRTSWRTTPSARWTSSTSSRSAGAS